ncbi:hypothetical protein J4418_05225 [Candidatus Woesearchaeota archaeon]|nr:hypothetical protein [Candidatus Woesearchaeota archaeon]
MVDPINITTVVDLTNVFGSTVQTIVNKINFFVGGGLLGKSTKPKTTETYFSRGYKPIKQKLDGSDKKLYKKQKSNFENKR